MRSGRLPTLFIPHGGGPCFFMRPPLPWPSQTWAGMEAFLRGLPAQLDRTPRAILIVSAHWEAVRPTINVAASHSLYFDYSGFPQYTYALTYPVAGDPDLAVQVHGLLAAVGIEADTERERGLDHGVFIPLKVAFPNADVPIVQLSLQQDLDPDLHLSIGRALAPLREEGVLIVGSGFSYHNLRELFSGRDHSAAEAFDQWLNNEVIDASTRLEALKGWRRAPGARASHPEAEHLLPLMVAAGAAGDDAGSSIYAERVFGKPVSAFRFG